MEPKVDFDFSVQKEFVEISYYKKNVVFHMLCFVHINNVDVDC